MAIKDDKTRITAIITKEVEQQISELAEQEERSMSAMAALLIKKGIESYKKEDKNI